MNQWTAVRSRPKARHAAYAALAIVLIVAAGVLAGRVTRYWNISSNASAAADSPEDHMRAALQRARQAKSYQVDLDIRQALATESAGPFTPPTRETAEFDARGYVGGHSQARFAITPRKVGQAILSAEPAGQAQEILVVGDRLYERQGDQWLRQNDATPMPGVNADGLLLLEAASNVGWLEPAERLTGRYERLGFTLHSRDVQRLLFSLKGAGNPQQADLAWSTGARLGGEGELWLDAAGWPARLVLELEIQRTPDDKAPAMVASTADYSNFGQAFAPEWFDPSVSPLSGASLSPLPGSGLTADQLAQAGLTLLAVALALLVCRLVMTRPSKAKAVAVSLLTIAAMLGAPLAGIVQTAQAAGQPAAANATTTGGKGLADLVQSTHDLLNEHYQSNSAALDPQGDLDQDGLPNGYEWRLGANPFQKDTDMDGLSDYQEVTGLACTAWIPDPAYQDPSIAPLVPVTYTIETNPLLADSNSDGLRDGDEFRGYPENTDCYGANPAGGPYAWNDDNDADGIPDDLDLSPFTHSGAFGGEAGFVGDKSYYYTDEVYEMGWGVTHPLMKAALLADGYQAEPGGNFTFESTDRNADPAITQPYPFYTEVQIRPQDTRLLQAAYKKALEWPEDAKGAIRRYNAGEAALVKLFTGIDLYTSGKIEVVPYLQVTVQGKDLPSPAALKRYSIGVNKLDADCASGNAAADTCAYALSIPLVPVERNGQVYAFQAKVLHDFTNGNTNLVRKWQDVRLKWLLRGDVLQANENGDFRPDPDDGHGLVVYDTPYTITGLQISRQGGSRMLVAGAYPLPGAAGVLFGDSPLALLRVGLEANFLSGIQDLAEIAQGFASLPPSSELRWGIPVTYTYAMAYQPAYTDLDAALMATNMTTTRQVLNQLSPAHTYSPTLVFASEQRVSTVNVDDANLSGDTGEDLFADLTLHTCEKPMITSRTLRIQTYRYDPLAGGYAAAVKGHKSPGLASPAAYSGPLNLGDWLPLSTDEMLDLVKSEFKQAWENGDIKNFFDEVAPDLYDTAGQLYKTVDELYQSALNVVELVTTAWYVGQTVVTKIGESLTSGDVGGLREATKVLEENGYLPKNYAETIYYALNVAEKGPLNWLMDQFSTRVESFLNSAGEILGSYFDFSKEYFSLPGEQTVLEYTRIAVNILTFLATITGSEFLAKVVQVVTRIIDAYLTIKQAINTALVIVSGVLSIVDNLDEVATQLLRLLASEAKALTHSLNGVGFVVGVAISWVMMFAQMMSGDLTNNQTTILVTRTMIETAIAVVLFVVLMCVPVAGQIIIAALAVITLVAKALGVEWDPVTALVDVIIDWLYGSDITQLTKLKDVKVGALHYDAQQPMASQMAGRKFGFWITSTAVIVAKEGGGYEDLKEASAGVELGWMSVNGGEFSLCTEDEALIEQHKRSFEAVSLSKFKTLKWGDSSIPKPGETMREVWNYCGTFRVEVDKKVINSDYIYHRWAVQPWSQTDKIVYTSDGKKKTIDQRATVNFIPRSAHINTWIPLDIAVAGQTHSLVEPGVATGYNDYKITDYIKGTPSVVKLDLDILPDKLADLWAWAELLNTDPDGDGLEGYQDPATHQWTGPDTRLCRASPGVWDTSTYNQWDSDDDGLSDSFERAAIVSADACIQAQPVYRASGAVAYNSLSWAALCRHSNPCQKDSDDDGLDDDVELRLGTNPRLPDTDGDGLKDGHETPYWSMADHTLHTPWRVSMNGDYPGLPEPAAFPSPLQANTDGDSRSDRQEKLARSSPTSYNPSSLGLTLQAELVHGGGSRVSVQTWPWLEEVGVMDAVLTLALPVTFSSAEISAGLAQLEPETTTPLTPQPGSGPLVYTWAVPPILFNTYLTATLTGLPEIPTGAVSVTAQLAYTYKGAARTLTDTLLLPVNRGGPTALVDSPAPGEILPAGVFTFTGRALDAEPVDTVLVCVKATPDCSGYDWQAAAGGEEWLYAWAPPASGSYVVMAYAIDAYGLPGMVSEVAAFQADALPPTDARFDLRGLAYLSRTFQTEVGAGITLTGRISDAAQGAFVSGVERAILHIESGSYTRDARVDSQPADQPGQVASAFAYRWHLPSARLGDAAGLYTLTLAATDIAGNVGGLDSLNILVDDAPPAVHSRLPKVVTGNTLVLSGRADDTGGDYRRLHLPFETSAQLSIQDLAFDLSSATGRAIVVGDLNGDTIEDVALLEPATGRTPMRLGLFFGAPGGFAANLALAQANVTFAGESANISTYPPAAAGKLDINGDGLDDLLVGDPGYSANVGRVYVVLGRRQWNPTYNLSQAEWKIPARSGAKSWGATLSPAGDVDGDGLSDFLIGAATDGSHAGAAYLIFGRETGVNGVKFIFYSPYSLQSVAATPPNLAGLGDVNSDGLSDFAIAYRGTSSPNDSGVGLIYGRRQSDWGSMGSINGMSAAIFSAPGAHQTVSAVGDIDGDGLNDLLIGDPLPLQSRVFVLLGPGANSTWPLPPARLNLATGAYASYLTSSTSGLSAQLGSGLTPMGDVDRDGRDDFAIGQPDYSSKIAIVLGGKMSATLDMPIQPETLLTSGYTSQRTGAYLSSGDINGDGIHDLLIGAPGNTCTYLKEGLPKTIAVAGVQAVKVGVFGPLTDPNLPYTATLPAVWLDANLSLPGHDITPWHATLPLGGGGEYRVYARAYDRAANTRQQDIHLGDVWVNPQAASLSGASLSLDAPTLVSGTQLLLSGQLAAAAGAQELRVFDGLGWQRLRPTAGAWRLQVPLQVADQRTLTVRAAARDANGVTLHSVRNVTVDTFVGKPVVTATLQLGQQALDIKRWQTDVKPLVRVDWLPVQDAGGPVQTWWAISPFSYTVPTNPATPPTWVSYNAGYLGTNYFIIKAQDPAGNARSVRIGPILLNNSKSPSVILPDGQLDLAAGEYPEGTLLNYDPYALFKPAGLWATWDYSKLYLGLPGNPWDANNRLTLYLNTRTGGLSSTLAPFGRTHSLPFAADYAFVVGGEKPGEYAMYAVNNNQWVKISPLTHSFAVVGSDTEIVLHRGAMGISAASPVSLLAYAEDAAGVWAVLPGSARPDERSVLTGTLAFVGALEWSALSPSGATPNAGLEQVIAPKVELRQGPDTTLYRDATTALTVTVLNPDIAPYVNQPLTVTVGASEMEQLGELIGVSGAACVSCPPHARQWVLAANVSAYSVQTITLHIKSLPAGHEGLYALPVEVRLGDTALAGQVQPQARASYRLDQVVPRLSAMRLAQTSAGQVIWRFMPRPGSFTRCLFKVEADTGQGFQTIGNLGDLFALEAALPANVAEWKLRVRGDNGLLSPLVTATVAADAIPPLAQVNDLAVAQTTGMLSGLAYDLTATQPPQRVEVSLNGGRFVPAILSGVSDPAQVAWALPVQFTYQDNEAITVSVRAVDAAGNVGPAQAAVFMVDVTGPAVTATQVANFLQGQALDGSDVSLLEVSLDGGLTYQAAQVQPDQSWVFDQNLWSGGNVGVALVRTQDTAGNISYKQIVLR